MLDLKSDRPKKDATIKQLGNSELYLKYLLSMVTFHYDINADDVVIKKAIATTDTAAIRKGPVHHSNSQENPDYRIEFVKPEAYKKGYISFKKLIGG